MSPQPLEAGDQRHLTWGSVRWSLARQMRLAADAAGGSVQYAAIPAGVDLELMTDQVRSFVPPDRQPPGLDAHDVWSCVARTKLSPRFELAEPRRRLLDLVSASEHPSRVVMPALGC